MVSACARVKTQITALDDVPLLVEQLLLEADELSASGAPDHEVDALITTALELLTGGPQQ